MDSIDTYDTLYHVVGKTDVECASWRSVPLERNSIVEFDHIPDITKMVTKGESE